MTIYESVKKGIDFIEANLKNDIGVSDVANAVCYSQFYFSREFSRHTHISVYNYILRRKLSESYKSLFQTGPKIVDLAFQYSFQSHEVFTRAFKKIFNENPSEANDYKPLAVYEPIDEQYLIFLNGLKVEIIEKAYGDCFFEAVSVSEMESGNNFLVLLSGMHLLSCKMKLEGNLRHKENNLLSYKLNGLKHKVRIYHNDAKLSFRYFTDNFYDVNEMGSNYILLKKEKDYIDIFIPCK